MYNFQIVSGGIKERDIKRGLKLRPSFDQAIEEDVEDPMLEQYRATGVFKSQKYQNILNNDIENLDSLQRNKIRSDLLKRDLIDGGVDIHQAQEQAIQQVRQPIIAQVQDPAGDTVESTLEEMFEALDVAAEEAKSRSSRSASLVSQSLPPQIPAIERSMPSRNSVDNIGDVVMEVAQDSVETSHKRHIENEHSVRAKPKTAPPAQVDPISLAIDDEMPQADEEMTATGTKRTVSKEGDSTPAKSKAKSGMFPPLYAGGTGEQPSSSSSAPAARTRQRSRSADPKKVGGSGEMPDEETAGRKYTGPVPMEIDSLLELTYLTPTVRKELESMSKDTTRDKHQYDTLPMISLNRTKRELMTFGVTDLMLQARHPKRNIQFGGNERRNKEGEIIRPATEVIVSGVNEKGKKFNITFNKKTLKKEDYVDILKEYEGN